MRNGTYNLSVCQTWYTASAGLNATYSGITSQNTFATWLPIIAVVIAAVVVIGLLVTQLGGVASGSRM